MAGSGSAETLRILLVSAQEAIRKQIADGLAGWSRNHRVFWVSQPDLAAVRAEGLQPHIVLLDDATGDTDFEQLIQQLGDSVPGVAILVLIAPDAVDAASRAVLAGAQAFLTKPINADELLLTLSQLDARGPQPAPPVSDAGQAGRVIAFCAPKGGTGRTTLAINTAIGLRQATRESVILVDGDFAAPAIDVALNLQPDRTIADLLPRLNRLDPDLLSSTLLTHSSGVRALLADSENASRNPLTRPQVQTLVLNLRRTSSWILIDLGLPTDEMAYAFLDAAELVVMSVLPEMIGLRNARLMLDQLYSRGYPLSKVWVVLNRDGLPGGMPLDELERWLGVRVNHRIPNNQELATETVNRGVPMAISHHDSELAGAYQAFARSVVEERGPQAEPNGIPAEAAAVVIDNPAIPKPQATQREESGMLHVENVTRNSIVVDRGRVANNYWTRLRGLIGVRHLPDGDGMAIIPCSGVHCMFMSVPIDVVYVTKEDCVAAIDHNMKPWAIGKPRKGVRYVLELPAGKAARIGLQVGDQLQMTH